LLLLLLLLPPQALYSVDPQLADHREHLDYRWNHYKWVKGNIENATGSLTEFAKVRNCPRLHGVTLLLHIVILQPVDAARSVGIATSAATSQKQQAASIRLPR
jgi:hypothetical protein